MAGEVQHLHQLSCCCCGDCSCSQALFVKPHRHSDRDSCGCFEQQASQLRWVRSLYFCSPTKLAIVGGEGQSLAEKKVYNTEKETICKRIRQDNAREDDRWSCRNLTVLLLRELLREPCQNVDVLLSNYNLYHFCWFRFVKQCTIAVNSVIN